MSGELWVSSNIQNIPQSDRKDLLLRELELNTPDIAMESIPNLEPSNSDTSTNSNDTNENENKVAQDLFQKILGKNKSKKKS